MEDVVQRDSKETIHFSTDFVWWIQARKSPQFFGACFMNVNKANVPKKNLTIPDEFAAGVRFCG